MERHNVADSNKLFVGVFQAGAQDNPRLAECLRDAHQFLTITQVPPVTVFIIEQKQNTYLNILLVYRVWQLLLKLQ